METKAHKIISIVWILIFVAFAIMQINDPDPVIWTSIYIGAALLPLWNIFRKVPPVISITAVILCIIWAVLLWPEQWQGLTGKMDSRPGVELARESLGLGICALGGIYVLIRGFRKS